MSFLTPLFLIGLLAVAVPVAIHFIRREKPPKLMFSTIRFLQKTSKKLILFQHIQQWLLLLLRAGLIILLVLAFARPLISQNVARMLNTDPESVVILLDASMSMRYQNIFANARREALAVLDGMDSGGEAAVIVFSGAPQTVRELNTDLPAVRRELAAIDSAGFGSTHYLSSLRLAARLLDEARYENRKIYLISDFQAEGFNRQDAVDFRLAPGVGLIGIDVGVAESVNLSLTDVRSPQRLLEGSGEQTVLARVRSTGTVLLEEGEVTLLINDEVVQRQPLRMEGRSEQVISFTAEFPAEGAYSGEVRLSGDEFGADNSRFFTVNVSPRIRVLVVNGEASADWFDDEGHWFSLAVAGDGESSPFLPETIEPQELNAAVLNRYDVVVLLNVGVSDNRSDTTLNNADGGAIGGQQRRTSDNDSRTTRNNADGGAIGVQQRRASNRGGQATLNNEQTTAIVNYVRGGGNVLFAPGDRVEPASFNRRFADITPAQLQSPELLPRDDYLVIGDYDRRHPIMRPLDTDWSARFQGRWSLTPAQDAEVLMRFDSTEPALLERTAGTGKAVLFASSLDLEWNNLALQGLYLPFVHQTLRYMAQTELPSKAWQVGDTINLLPTGSQSGQNLSSITAADGTPLNNDSGILTATTPGIIRATIATTERPYAATGTNATAATPKQRYYAVNIDPRESNLLPMAFSSLQDAVINPDTEPARSSQVQTTLLMQELERPQSLWWWILCLATLLALFEIPFANRTHR